MNLSHGECIEEREHRAVGQVKPDKRVCQGIPVHCHDLLEHDEYGASLWPRVLNGLQHHCHKRLIEG